MTGKRLGAFGEDKAVEYLVQDGYRILDRNFRTKLGEIDIIARRGDTVKFIEVKTRRNEMFGMAAQAVDSRKMQHIRRVAEIYMRQTGLHPLRIGFDVFEVYFNHIEYAF